MTQIDAATLNAEDIEDDFDRPTETLERAADRILAEDRAARTHRPVDSVRAAVREDLERGREWSLARAGRTRAAIEQEPLKATLYALGAGVLLGLLLRR